jgi:hypothetical protein
MIKPGWTRKMTLAPNCPKENLHTPTPEGYIQHAEWADQRMKTHTQIKCPGCGLYAIWIKR